MGKSKEIRNVAIVGTGVIGASWAALYLAPGLKCRGNRPGAECRSELADIH
jgi:hypothetical protein